MKSIKKIITAAAAAAVIATVGATTAFAISNAADSVTAGYKPLEGNYINLEYGPGFATTVNKTQYTRLVNASVKVYSRANASNDYLVTQSYNNGVVGMGQAVTANV